jgi:hypothetical protein
MRAQLRSATFVKTAIAILILLATCSVWGDERAASRQSPSKRSPVKRGTLPRTADGQPDLQGTWDFRTITPLERPAVLGDKEFLTDDEAADLEHQKAEFEAVDPRDRKTTNPAFTTARIIGDPIDEQAYNSEWFDTGSTVIPSRRTALILNPSSGRIPYTDDGGQRATRRRGRNDPEERGLTERCILSLNAGPPVRPSAYNNNLQIVQTAGYVVIVNEMIHDARIIPLDGRPHIPQPVSQWRGDSRGHWERSTLVVETTNFDTRTGLYGSTAGLRVVERFRRAGPDTIDYEFTVSDPATFVSAWTAAFPLRKSEAQMYEYACHEGNYGLQDILAGARAEERTAEGSTIKR